MPGVWWLFILFVLSHFGYSQQRYQDRYKNDAIRSEGTLYNGLKEGE